MCTTSRSPLMPLEALAAPRAPGVTLHQHIYGSLRGLILQRTLRPGTRLPSSRTLAGDLGISRNVVISAYARLESEGYIESRHGSGSYVVDLPGAALPARPPAPEQAEPHLSRRGDVLTRLPSHDSFPGHTAFHPGSPDVRGFPFALWRRLIARRLRPYGDDLFGYHDIAGHPPLREAIAGYLEGARGVRCEPDQILVTTGAQASLDLLVRLLVDPGDAVWAEEPGHLGVRGTFEGAGARLLPLHVDESGWDLDRQPDRRVRLILTTPSCQFPLGITMPLDQRLRLLEIAHRHDAWIIEDDFDSEYRFGGKPIPAMQGIDHTGRTIYVGTFSKTLFPSLRLGFMVLPQPLAARFKRASAITGQFAPLVLQGALAEFIERGHFAKYVRRTRRLYTERRQLFIELCARTLGPWLRRIEGSAGIQTTWLLRQELSDLALAEQARRRWVNVTPLSVHYRHGQGPNGLILGYAAVQEPELRDGLAALSQVLSAMDPTRSPSASRRAASAPARPAAAAQ